MHFQSQIFRRFNINNFSFIKLNNNLYLKEYSRKKFLLANFCLMILKLQKPPVSFFAEFVK